MLALFFFQFLRVPWRAAASNNPRAGRSPGGAHHASRKNCENSQKENVILVDCLTLWLSNLLMETDDEKKLEKMIAQLTAALEKAPGTIVMVSNEIGTGIVPENKLARQYRDIIGLVNQAVAKTASKVIWMVAGIPVTIKG